MAGKTFQITCGGLMRLNSGNFPYQRKRGEGKAGADVIGLQLKLSLNRTIQQAGAYLALMRGRWVNACTKSLPVFPPQIKGPINL